MFSDFDYHSAYTQACRMGAFTILDNGAAEGSTVTPDALLKIAKDLLPSEIVCPDVLQNAEETKYQVKCFADKATAFKNVHETIKYMAVVQGVTLDELYDMVDFYAGYGWITTLGIPRWLISKFSKAVRIDLATWVKQRYDDRFEIHLLGTNSEWYGETRSVGRYAPFVRSIDTSLPYNLAMVNKGIWRVATETHLPVQRPKDYFIRDYKHLIKNPFLQDNIMTLRRWAKGE